MNKLKRKGGQVVGFIITPGEIANRIAALDNSIQALDRSIKGNLTPALNLKWRDAWDGYVRRWAIERDSYATVESRMFATRVMPRIEAYEQNYRIWAIEFQARTGLPPNVPGARPSEGYADIIPTQGWLLAGVAVLAYLYLKK